MKYLSLFSGIGGFEWKRLIDMQMQTDGSYYHHKTIFGFTEQFWKKNQKELEQRRIDAQTKYNTR